MSEIDGGELRKPEVPPKSGKARGRGLKSPPEISPPPVPPERGEEGVGDREGVTKVSSPAGDVKGIEVGQVKGREVRRMVLGVRSGKGLILGTGSAPIPYKLNRQRTAEAVFKHWPNMSKAAQELGVTRGTLSWHKHHTPWFQQIVEAADAKGCDALEQVLFDRGVSGDEYTFNDRIAYLRAHRPELYDRAKVIKLEDNRMPMKEAAGRARLAQEAVDAEIVEDYRSRKALRAMRKKEAGAGGGVA